MKKIKVNFGQLGYAAGRVASIDHTATGKIEKENSSGSELARFMDAVDKMTQILGKSLDGANEKNSKVIEAELMLLNDMEFCGAIYKLIENDGVSAVDAVRYIGQKNAEELLRGADKYISERAQDIRGITKGLIDILDGTEDDSIELLHEPAIIVADEMTTYDMSRVNQENILGIISRKGSRMCHVSIMAGNLGIPYVYGVDLDIEEISRATQVIISSESGCLILYDADETPADDITENGMDSSMPNSLSSATECDETARDIHTRTKICLNISGCEDAKRISESRADGVGLLRSEFMFLQNEYPPSEAEQYEAYVRILDIMGDKPVIIRVLDIGGDKCVPWIEDIKEPNPAMGLKGIRFLLSHRDILNTQLRALLRASSHGKLKIMFPMITSVQEMPLIRSIIEETASTLRKEGVPVSIPEIGAEIETPAAALLSDSIATQSDFFSIGTNDLAQYTLAVDRESSALESYFDVGGDALLRLIRMTVDAAHNNGIKVAVCGEMASDPEYIPKLVDAGIDGLSVSLERVDRTRVITKEAEEKLND